MSGRVMGFLVLLTSASVGCEQPEGGRADRASGSKGEASVVVAANTPAGTAVTEAGDASEIGTEADFEEEAETTLDVEDIDGALDAIEKEIGK